MRPVDRAAAQRMWAAYREAHPTWSRDSETPSVERFGDNPELSDELLAMVLAGDKRATATLVKEFAAEGQELPRVGDHWIACDAAGTPRAILRSIELRLGTIDTVDASFAYDEAEGDRSLDTWRRGHSAYWERVCDALGSPWSAEDEIVFERFTVAWTSPA